MRVGAPASSDEIDAIPVVVAVGESEFNESSALTRGRARILALNEAKYRQSEEKLWKLVQ